MTQQPVYAPQYPQAPYPPQQPVYPQQPVQYAPPPQQQYAAPPQAPAGPPPAQGSLDDYYAQPTGTAGPGISWKDKPLGTSYIGTVTRDVTNGDIVQDTDFTTKQPKTYRDGRPIFVMKVPLINAPTQEFPDGEFAFWVRGQAREELVRAMAEAGVEGAPKAGAVIQVTLTQRKPSRMGNPANIVAIVYTPPGATAAPVAAAPAPVAEAVPVQPVVQAAPVAVAQPVAVQTVPQVQVPVAEQPQALAVPAGLDADQAALLAKLTGG